MYNIYDDSIGKMAYYEINDELRKAFITGYEYHEGLKKIVFTLESKYKNAFRLSVDEIKLILWK